MDFVGYLVVTKKSSYYHLSVLMALVDLKAQFLTVQIQVAFAVMKGAKVERIEEVKLKEINL